MTKLKYSLYAPDRKRNLAKDLTNSCSLDIMSCIMSLRHYLSCVPHEEFIDWTVDDGTNFKTKTVLLAMSNEEVLQSYKLDLVIERADLLQEIKDLKKHPTDALIKIERLDKLINLIGRCE